MSNRALFLDRDGTLVHPRHYPSRPDQLILYDGIVDELRRFQTHGFRLIVITNQAGLARGIFSADDLARMHAYLTMELALEGVRLDGIYHCPHHPHGIIPELAVRCECRKPRPGMLFRAAVDLCIDLQRSWFVGDILDDVEAGRRAGCRTVLVDLGTEQRSDNPLRQPHFVARSTLHALELIAGVEAIGPAAEETYQPFSWTQPSQPLHGMAQKHPRSTINPCKE